MEVHTIKNTKSNITRINENSDKKKMIKEKKKKKININKEKNNTIKIKKIKQSFVDTVDFVYTDTLILRLISKSGLVLEECTRKSESEITHNGLYRIGNKVLYKEGLLTIITNIIKDEKDLVYVVQEANDKIKKQYLDSFGEDAFKMKNSFKNEITYKSCIK